MKSGKPKSEHPASKQLPNRKYQNNSRFDHSSPSIVRSLFRIPDFGARIFFIIAFIGLSPRSHAQTETLFSPLVYASSSIDGLNCIASYDLEDEPQVTDNSSDWPGDPEENATMWADQIVFPSRHDSEFELALLTNLVRLTLPSLEHALVLLPPVHSVLWLHEHNRTRGPPVFDCGLRIADCGLLGQFRLRLSTTSHLLSTIHDLQFHHFSAYPPSLIPFRPPLLFPQSEPPQSSSFHHYFSPVSGIRNLQSQPPQL